MMVDELTEHLAARGYGADKLHGDMTQAMRERVMAKFRRRAIEFLVATDVAARGLDVDDIEVVFNYDLPHDGEDYVHRIGRTGRAGKSGRAITFVAGREIYKLQNISRFTKSRIRRERVPTIEQVEEKRANLFFDSLRETLEQGEYKRHDELIDRLLDQGHAPTDIASALIHLLGADKPRPSSAPTGPTDTAQPSSSRAPAFIEPQGDERPYREERRGFEERPHSRRDAFLGAESPVSHEAGMVRLSLNAGRKHQIMPGDIVGVILGAARIPKESVGAILLHPTHSFVDVAEEFVKPVLTKLNGIQFKGRKLFISIAAAEPGDASGPAPQAPEEPPRKAKFKGQKFSAPFAAGKGSFHAGKPGKFRKERPAH
jgi:ATP-dependent RNA helicase DeaD